jgi:hypothetical protein
VAYFGDTDCLRTLNLSTGEVTTAAGSCGIAGNQNGVGTLAGFGNISRLLFDGSDTLYVIDAYYCQLRAFRLSTREVTTLCGGPGLCGVSSAQAVDGNAQVARFVELNGADLDGSLLYLTDKNTLRRVDLSSVTVTTLAGVSGYRDFRDGVGDQAWFLAPKSVAVSDGAAYVLDAGTLRKVDLQSRQVTTIAGFPGTSSFASGVGASARLGGASTLARGEPGELLLGGRRVVAKFHLATRGVSLLLGSPLTYGTSFSPAPLSQTAPHPVRLAPHEWLVSDADEGVLAHVR